MVLSPSSYHVVLALVFSFVVIFLVVVIVVVVIVVLVGLLGRIELRQGLLRPAQRSGHGLHYRHHGGRDSQNGGGGAGRYPDSDSVAAVVVVVFSVIAVVSVPKNSALDLIRCVVVVVAFSSYPAAASPLLLPLPLLVL